MRHYFTGIAALALAGATGVAHAQSSVQYGRITAVTLTTQENARAQTGGAIAGGTIGLVSGRNRSGSNQALRGIGGAVAGQQLTRMATNQQAFEYTILVGQNTIRMVSDEGGFRVGDCVAVERGGWNNLRLVDDSRCNVRAGAPAPKPTPNAQREANACDQAKDQLLAAKTDEEFDRAERRVRLLCD